MSGGALQDRIGSAAFLSLAVLVMGESVRLSLGDAHNPGPGFVPFYLALAVAFLSGLSLLWPDRREKPSAFWKDYSRGQGVLGTLFSLALYLGLIRIIGFYLDTFLLLIFLMKLAGEKGCWRALLVAVSTMALLYVGFARLLSMQFPRGILGF